MAKSIYRRPSNTYRVSEQPYKYGHRLQNVFYLPKKQSIINASKDNYCNNLPVRKFFFNHLPFCSIHLRNKFMLPCISPLNLCRHICCIKAEIIGCTTFLKPISGVIFTALILLLLSAVSHSHTSTIVLILCAGSFPPLLKSPSITLLVIITTFRLVSVER